MTRHLFTVMICAGLLGAGTGFAQDTGEPFEEEEALVEGISATIINPVSTSPGGPQPRLHTWGDHVRTGTLVFLGLFALLGLAAIAERFVNLRQSKIVPDLLPSRAAELWRNKKYAELSTLCAKDGGVLGRVIGTLLENRGNQDVTLVKMLVEDKARRELRLASRRTGTLLTVATIAPLLGLCGTFAGLFGAFATVDMELKSILVVEIAKALSTTVAGLMVAMPMLLFYQVFRSRANFFAILLEEEVSKLVNNWFVRNH